MMVRALAVAILAAVPPFGSAADRVPEAVGVLPVAPPPGPGQELVGLARAVRVTVAARIAGVVPEEELRRRIAGDESTGAISELTRAYAGAISASQRGDAESAVGTLRAIVADLERAPESPDAFALWSKSMLRLARAEGMLGHAAEAHALLQRLVRANPTVEADLELFPPGFIRELDAARKEIRAASVRKLTVTAGARPARVFVAGRDVGIAPVTVTVAPGRYRVSGVIGTVRTTAGEVEVAAEDRRVALDLELQEAFRPADGPGLSLPAARQSTVVVQAGAALRLDRVVAVWLAEEAGVRYLVGSVYDVRRGALQREGKLRISGATPPDGGAEALAAFLINGEPSRLIITPADLAVRPSEVPLPAAAAAAPTTPAVRSRAGERPDSRLLGWSALGAGALAVGLGAFAGYEAVVASGKSSDAKAMLGHPFAPGDRTRYNGLVADGDSARGRAAWAAGGAGVALAAGAVLGYLSYRSTGEVGPFRF